jgi:hypothetical protein
VGATPDDLVEDANREAYPAQLSEVSGSGSVVPLGVMAAEARWAKQKKESK